MAEPVGQDIRHASLSSSAHEVADGITRSGHGHGDDQGLLSPKRLHQCGVVVAAVVDADNLQAVGQLAGAARACDGCYDMLAGLEQVLCQVLSHLAARLSPN